MDRTALRCGAAGTHGTERGEEPVVLGTVTGRCGAGGEHGEERTWTCGS